MAIVVREARMKDCAFVRNLAVDAVVHGIPHTRDVDPAYVQMRTRQSLANLEMAIHTEKDFKILVAEDDAKGDLVGYIMLDFGQEESCTGERQCLIHDLAVRRDYWGRMVVHRLMRAAEQATAARGLKYLVGEVTKANENTVGTAVRGLGFEIERHQIVKRVDRPTVRQSRQPTADRPQTGPRTRRSADNP